MTSAITNLLATCIPINGSSISIPHEVAVSKASPTINVGRGPLNFYDQISHQLLARASTAPTIDEIFNFFENDISVYTMPDVFGSTDAYRGF